MSERELLRRTAEIAAEFLESLDDRPVWPPASVDGAAPGARWAASRRAQRAARRSSRSWPRHAEPGVVAIPGGRYFGFVIGGSLPAALAADWLTSAWDQNAGLVVGGPAAAVVEEVAGEWLKELFGLPPATSFAFVTGCQMAHVDLPGRRSARGARARRLGCRAQRAERCAACPRLRRREAPRDGGSRTAPARARHRVDRGGAGGRPGSNAPERAGGGARRRRRPGDRMRAGGRGEHGRRRCDARDRGALEGGRAPGSTSTAPSGCGPPRRPSSAISSRAWARPTRGRPTRTSGSTSHTTAGWRSSLIPKRIARRWR